MTITLVKSLFILGRLPRGEGGGMGRKVMAAAKSKYKAQKDGEPLWGARGSGSRLTGPLRSQWSPSA